MPDAAAYARAIATQQASQLDYTTRTTSQPSAGGSGWPDTAGAQAAAQQPSLRNNDAYQPGDPQNSGAGHNNPSSAVHAIGSFQQSYHAGAEQVNYARGKNRQNRADMTGRIATRGR